MENVIKFIEKYLEEPTKYSKNTFKVTYESVLSKDMFCVPTFNNRHTYSVITLDDEDLKYLYDKYLPFYHEQKLIETTKEEEGKLKEIKELQAKIDKIRNS